MSLILAAAALLQGYSHLTGEIGENLSHQPFLEVSSSKKISSLQMCLADAVSKDLNSSFLPDGYGNILMVTHFPWNGNTNVPLIIKMTETETSTALTLTGKNPLKDNAIRKIKACL